MSLLGRIFIGLICILLGVFLVIKTEIVLRTFGRIQFFEDHLRGYGGSRLAYKLFGLAFCFAGGLIITGQWSFFIEGALSPLLEATQRSGGIKQ